MRGETSGADRYDLVSYAGQPEPSAHCRRLETVATLFGLSPPPPSSARVLDLGCGMGAGLLPQALEYPAARFVGCDRARTHIAKVSEAVAALGVRNIELWQRDLCDANASWGQFDYIVCQGVFSWVGPDVRRRLLDILRHNLSPRGIAYVSFNVLPGWHLRRVARDLMCHQGGRFDDPWQAIAQARSMLALMAEAQPDDGAYATLIRQEFLSLSRQSDSYVFHEMLAEHNQPFFFQEFAAQIESAGLQYLGAAELPRMFAWDLPGAARDFLDSMPTLEREQCLDFLRGSTFRRSLVCHQELRLDRQPDPSRLRRFWVGLRPDAQVEFSGQGDHASGAAVSGGLEGRLVVGACHLAFADPRIGGALRLLDARRPEFLSVRALLQAASEHAGCQLPTTVPAHDADDRHANALRFLMDAVTMGALDAVISPPHLACRAGERPAISLLARFQAETGTLLTNQKHESIRITEVGRLIARLLDGTRDRRTLTDAVHRAIKDGVVSLGVFDYVEDLDDIDQVVENKLMDFGRAALLVA